MASPYREVDSYLLDLLFLYWYNTTMEQVKIFCSRDNDAVEFGINEFLSKNKGNVITRIKVSGDGQGYGWAYLFYKPKSECTGQEKSERIAKRLTEVLLEEGAF